MAAVAAAALVVEAASAAASGRAVPGVQMASAKGLGLTVCAHACRYSNRYYARVGGVGLTELNRLELAFLKLVKFDLTVSKEEYAVYRSTVLLACPKRPVSNALPAEAHQQQQQQPQQHAGAPDAVPSGIDSSSSDCCSKVQRSSLDVVTPALQQVQSRALVQHLQQQQEHQQQQQCSRGLVAVSTASTVSTTPEAGPPRLPAGSSTGAGAVAAAAVSGGAAAPTQQQQQERNMECLQRTEVLSQEGAMVRSNIHQQQWQSCGQQYVGAYEQQQRQALQQTRLMVEAQIQQQQATPKLQSRLCSQERLMELQHQHHRQLIRAQQLLLLREYHQQQQLLLEQQQQQQLLLLRQQQQLLLLQEGDVMIKEAAMSPSNSFAPTSRCNSRDSLSMCGGFGMETEDKMTTAASDEELQLASPMNGLRDVLTAEVP